MSVNTIRRPLLRYPGGKWRLAKWIISHFPPYKFYVEPYGGAASVLMSKPRTKGEVLNDINGEIVNVYRVLRDRKMSEELERLIVLTPFAREEYELAYEFTDDPVESARRTIFRAYASIGTDGVNRAQAGFRGMKNFESRLTTASEWWNYWPEIRKFTERLQEVVIENRPAIQVIQQYDTKETFVYADPPYMLGSRARQDRNLYAYEMGETPEEEEVLHRELSETLHNMQGSAIISHYDCPLYQELYYDWKKESTEARAMGNAPRVECIWMSPGIQPKLF